MNKDDAELFGKLKTANLPPDDVILLIDRRKLRQSGGMKYAYHMLKKHTDLTSIKYSRLFSISGCPDFSIAYATSKNEDFDVQLSSEHSHALFDCEKKIKKMLASYVNIQHKHLKIWNNSVTERCTYDGICYTYCVSMKKEVLTIYRFLHASNERNAQPVAPSKPVSAASSLMAQFNNSKEMARASMSAGRRFPPSAGGAVPVTRILAVPKKWRTYDGFLDRLLFLREAKLSYQGECYNDSTFKKAL